MTAFITPYPPSKDQMVDGNGYLTRKWSAWFDGFYQNTNVFFAGIVLEWAGKVAPLGWLLCDGSSYSTADYPELYAAIGNSFGGDVSAFKVPDKRGKFSRGAADPGTVGSTGGADSIEITESYLPAIALDVTDAGHTHHFAADPHTHNITDPGHAHSLGVNSVGAGGMGTGGTGGGITTGNATTGITINTAVASGNTDGAVTGIAVHLPGGGTPLPIAPPYLEMNFIIKY